MTTHRRAVLFRVSAVAVLTAGAIAGVATPAYAATTIELSDNSFTIGPSQPGTLQVRLSGDVSPVTVTVTVPSAVSSDVLVEGTTQGCVTTPAATATCEDVTVPETGNKQLSFRLTAKSPSTIPVGESKSGSGGTVKLAFGNESKSFAVTVRGPTQAAPVPEVSGRVTDSITGMPIKDATVVVEDGANNSHQAGTDAQGNFKVVSGQGKSITPGQIKIGAAKEGFETIPKLVDGRSGVPLTGQQIKLKPAAATSMTAIPEVTDTGAATDPSLEAEGETDGNAGGSGSGAGGPGMISWILIALGAILVLLGIGAIILLLRRRSDDDEEEGDEEGEPVRPNRRGPVPAVAGARAGGPGGYRNQADPTMVNRAPMGAAAGAPTRANLNDATAIVRPAPVAVPPRSTYPTSPGPNNYGPPPAPQSYAGPGGYAPNQPGYGPAAAGGAGYSPDPGYGPANGYGPSSRPPADGYSASDYAGGGYGPSSGYGPAPSPRYGDEESTQRYDAGGYDAGGYGSRGYPGGAPSGGYDDAGHNGYDPRASSYDPGYDRDAYERPEPRGNSYDPGGGYGPSSYDGPGGRSGYDNGYSPPPPQQRGAPDRRSLDWLDD